MWQKWIDIFTHVFGYVIPIQQPGYFGSRITICNWTLDIIFLVSENLKLVVRRLMGKEDEMIKYKLCGQWSLIPTEN